MLKYLGATICYKLYIKGGRYWSLSRINICKAVTYLLWLLVSSLCLAQNPKLRIDTDYQYFYQNPLGEKQGDSYWSLAAELKFFWQTEAGDDVFSFIPYIRRDRHDGSEGYFDVRELLWTHIGDSVESRIGINKVFWGVTESQHLVDIINQTDFVTAIDGEEKIGQPMINLSFARDWGIVDLFILPYFREQDLSNEERRFYLGTEILGAEFALNDALYKSSKKERHIDVSARWTTSFSGNDLALSYFSGTIRMPTLKFSSTTNTVNPNGT